MIKSICKCKLSKLFWAIAETFSLHTVRRINIMNVLDHPYGKMILNIYFLLSTGMWKLEVSHNKVSSIPPMAFYGLERALWELHLHHNRLIRVPADSIALLKKLAVLNLAGKKAFLMKYNSCIQFCMIVRNLLVWLWPRTKKKRNKSKKII